MLFDTCRAVNKLFLGCAGSLLLLELSSTCGELGYSAGAVHRLLIAMASLIAEHGLEAPRLQ